MKNFPLFLKNNKGRYKNWTNSYLKELDTKITSLFDYTNYFIPDYYRGALQEIIISEGYSSDSSEDSDDITVLDIRQLKYREYVIVESKSYDAFTGQYINAGSRVVSRAQAEGEIDSFLAENINKKDNYFIQPIGWASFYLISGANNQVIFNYDQYAEETYGTTLRFTFETYPRRWYIDNINAGGDNSQTEDGLVFSKDTQNSELSAISSADDHIIIRDKIGTEWVNSSNYPIFYFTLFYDSDITPEQQPMTYGEEIIIDSKGLKTTEFVETNKGVYTISRKNGAERWPHHGVALIY